MRFLLLLLLPFSLCAQTSYPSVFTAHGPGGGGYMYTPSVNPHNAQDIFLNCDMGGVYRSLNGGRNWTLQPGWVSSVKGKVQFTSSPDTLYVCRRSVTNQNDPLFRGELARSIDGGQTWQPMSDPTGSGVHRLEADPGSTKRLILNEYNQLFFTSDGGANWKVIYHPFDDQMWLGGVFWDGNDIYVGTGKGLLVSHNGGNSFAIEPHSGLPAGAGLLHLSGAKNGNNIRLFTIVANSADMNAWNDVLDFRGQIWGMYKLNYAPIAPWSNAKANIPSDVEISWVDLSDNNIQTVWASGATIGGLPLVYKSTNGGQSWENTFNALENENVRTGWGGDYGAVSYLWSGAGLGFDVDNHNPDHVIVTDGLGHITKDGGLSWSAIYVDPASLNNAGTPTPIQKNYTSSGLDVTTTHQLFWQDSVSLFAANTDIALTWTGDAGASWTFARNTFYPWGTLANPNWYRIVQRPDNQHLYAAISEINDMYLGYRISDAQVDGVGLVARSVNNGITWDTVYNFNNPVVWLELDPVNPARMYASVVHHTEGGIFRTDDSGVSWTKLPLPARTEGHPYNIICLKNGGILATFSARDTDGNGNLSASSGVFYSPDGGNTWLDRTSPYMQYYTKDIVVEPSDSTQSTWYATVWGRYSVWPGPVNESNGGVYRTTNRGENWTRVFAAETTESITIHPENANLAYVTVENDALYLTENLQATDPNFGKVNSFPFWRPKRVFFKPDNPCEVWVTTMGGGIWKGDHKTVANLSAGFSTFVNGLSVNFTGTSANALAYTWNFGDGTPIAVGQNPKHDYAAPGTYTVVLTAHWACTSITVEKMVIVNCPPLTLSLMAQGPTQICPGTSVQLITDTGYADYDWYYNGALIPGANSSALMAQQPGNYWASIPTIAGCTAVSSTIAVTLKTVAVPSFTVVPNDLEVNFFNTSMNADAYDWDFGDSSPVQHDFNPVHVYAQSGTYLITLTVTSDCGTSSYQRYVTVTCPLIQVSATIIGNTVICPPSNVTIQATSGYSNYVWSHNGTPLPPQISPELMVSQPGSYFVTAFNPQGCKGISNNIVVGVGITANPGFTADVDGLTVTFTNTSTNALFYAWDFGDGSPVNTNTNPVHTYANPGVYQVSLNAINTICGLTNIVQSVAVSCAPSAVTIAANGATQICAGETVVLNATTNPAFTQYTWYQNGVLLAEGPNPSLSVTANGIYKVFAAEAAGCGSFSNEITIEVAELPVIGIQAPAEIVCPGTPAWLSATGGNGYLWQLPNGTFSEQQSLVFNPIAPADAGTYRVTVTNGSGCTASSVYQLEVYPQNVLAISPAGTQQIIYGQVQELTTTGGATGWLWSNGATTAAIEVTQCGNYAVRAQDENGCNLYSDTVVVVVQPVAAFGGGLLLSSPADTYQWFLNGTPISGATNQTFTPVVSGEYSVQVGCSGSGLVFSNILGLIITGTDALPTLEIQALYPNPLSVSAELLNITVKNDEIREVYFIITDVSGKTIQDGMVPVMGGRLQVPVQAAPAGIYMIHLISGRQFLGSGRVGRI